MGFNDINIQVSGPQQPASTYKTKVLKGQVPFATQVTEPNTKYVIKHNFVINGDVTIPENCILEFDGGSISGEHTVTGANTGIEAGLVKIFDTDVTIAGTWNVTEAYPEWFGAFPNNSAIDVTPIIYKLLGLSKTLYFSKGLWYLSECLLVGDGISLIGDSTHYSVNTQFTAFNNDGQRFIVKLGGRADFDNPVNHEQSYSDVNFKNFKLIGIQFLTYGVTFENADNSGTLQNYGAVCFDWCSNGFVDIKFGGETPAVFIANTWEVYFECIAIYGCYIKPDEAALYFGKAYTNLESSNISAVTINNLFGENIQGKFVDYNSPNIVDLIINNIEFENYSPNQSYVIFDGENARNYIQQNLRSSNISYFINLQGRVLINNIIGLFNDVVFSYNDITYIKALLCSTAIQGSQCSIKCIMNTAFNYGDIIIKSVLGELLINEVECYNYNYNAIYTVLQDMPSLTGVWWESISSSLQGNIKINITHSIINPDLIKTYNKGLIFDVTTFYEVCSLIYNNNSYVPYSGIIDGKELNFIRTGSSSLKRKFKFEDVTKLIFTHIGANQWASKTLVIDYYSDGSVIHSDNVLLPNRTTPSTTEYTLYDGTYDYMIINTYTVFGLISCYAE